MKQSQTSSHPLHRSAASVSIVVCCHNSASRLPETLKHIQAQQDTEGVEWEVVIVDNCSTDGTSDLASSLWAFAPVAPLRIVREARLGLRHAREQGVASAAFDIISFVDDDNWISKTWVSQVSRIFTENAEIGACGGPSSAVFQNDAPEWFSDYAACYAVGAQYPESGDVTWQDGHLWGAGLNVRKRAWMGLYEDGFAPMLMGRRGKALTSGEDYELCYALRLSGWRLWYEQSLTLQHAIPESRLSLDYLSRLWEGFGAQSVVFDVYQRYVSNPLKPRTLLARAWLFQLARELFIAVKRDRSVWHRLQPPGRKASLRSSLNWRWHYGRICALFRAKSRYDRQLDRLPGAKWVKISSSTAQQLLRDHQP